MKLYGKVALVTGAARGIGWEIVQSLAQAGARVALCDLAQSDIDTAVSLLALPPENVLALRADVTSERDVAAFFRHTVDKFSHLDVVVNNAGFAWPRGGPVNLALADTPLDVWLKVLDTNLTGTFLCSREALEIMRAQGGGAIINISSPQGKKGECYAARTPRRNSALKGSLKFWRWKMRRSTFAPTVSIPGASSPPRL